MKFLVLFVLLAALWGGGANAGVSPVAGGITVDQFQARQINNLKQQIRQINATLGCYKNVAKIAVVTRSDDEGVRYLVEADPGDDYVNMVTLDKDCE